MKNAPTGSPRSTAIAFSTAIAEKTSGSTKKAKGRMPLKLFITTLTSALLAVMAAGGPALAQKAGGILKLSHRDSPASISILEESTGAALQPMMGVFNNLVMYDQHIAQSSLETIVPDLATSWSWSEDGTELTFPLRQGVKWHDGKPFTAADVKCTWDLLMGRGSHKLRLNPRKSWYDNVAEVVTRGDFEVSFKLKRRVGHRSIPATCRRARCVSIRSVPARSNSSR